MWIILGIFKEICLHFSYKCKICVTMWKIVPSTCYVSGFPLSMVELWITWHDAANPIHRTLCSHTAENLFSTCGYFSRQRCGNAQNLWINVPSVVQQAFWVASSALFLLSVRGKAGAGFAKRKRMFVFLGHFLPVFQPISTLFSYSADTVRCLNRAPFLLEPYALTKLGSR